MNFKNEQYIDTISPMQGNCWNCHHSNTKHLIYAKTAVSKHFPDIVFGLANISRTCNLNHFSNHFILRLRFSLFFNKKQKCHKWAHKTDTTFACCVFIWHFIMSYTPCISISRRLILFLKMFMTVTRFSSCL